MRVRTEMAMPADRPGPRCGGEGRASARLARGYVPLLALAFASAAALATAATDVRQQQQRSLFQRTAKVIQGAFLGGQTAVAAAEAEQPPKLEDPWETQRGLKMVRRLLDGDQLGVVLDMARNPELEQIWENPRATFRLLQSYPMLGGIRGVKDIMAKSEAEITPGDVRLDLNHH